MKYVLLFALFAMIGCTEEISNEVKNSSSSDNRTLTEVEKFRNKSIRLVHKMEEDLSFVMHKYGNINQPCEIEAPALGFSAEDYTKTDANRAIDCVLDAEELDIYQNGATVELQVDEFLCEYIEYEPYSFVNDLYGASFNTYYTVQCEGVCEEALGICGNSFDSYDGSGSGGFSTEYEEAGDACEFNYQDRNCDIGWSQEVQVTFATYDHDGDEETPEICQTASHSKLDTQEREACGGEISACLEGPGKDFTQTISHPTYDAFSYGREMVTIYNNEDLEEFTQEFTYDAPMDSHGDNTNMSIVNYSRMCANLNNMAKSDNYSVFSTVNLNGSEVEIMNKKRIVLDGSGNSVVLDPFEHGFTNESGDDIGDIYTSYNQTIDATNQPGFKAAVNSGNISSFLTITPGEDKFGWYSFTRDPDNTNQIQALQMAHHPLHAAYGVRPYYSFKCQDKARDTKAQIRLWIREWDRRFQPNNTYLSQSSDFDVSSTSDKYMDLHLDAQDGTEFWNDYTDLDDYFLRNGVFTNNNEQCLISDKSDDGDEIFDPLNGDKHVRSSFPKIQ